MGSFFCWQVRHQLVWVWAESGPEAFVEAAMTPPNSVEELEGPEQPIYMANWFMRDLPYGFDTLAENVLDPRSGMGGNACVLGRKYCTTVLHRQFRSWRSYFWH